MIFGAPQTEVQVSAYGPTFSEELLNEGNRKGLLEEIHHIEGTGLREKK